MKTIVKLTNLDKQLINYQINIFNQLENKVVGAK
jgi:hypothetical protein